MKVYCTVRVHFLLNSFLSYKMLLRLSNYAANYCLGLCLCLSVSLSLYLSVSYGSISQSICLSVSCVSLSFYLSVSLSLYFSVSYLFCLFLCFLPGGESMVDPAREQSPILSSRLGIIKETISPILSSRLGKIKETVYH